MTLLVVDNANITLARQLLPSQPITCPAELEGKTVTDPVLLWCHNATLVAEDFCRSAASVQIVNGDKTIKSFAGNRQAVVEYARANRKPYTLPAAPAAPDVPPEAPDEPVEAPVQPQAPAVDVDAVVKAATTDPGAVFQPDVLNALACLPDADFIRARDFLKRETRVPVSKLDKALRPVVVSLQAARAARQPKPEASTAADVGPLSDDALAKALSERHPELRYVARWGKWLSWDGHMWREDETLQVYDLAREVCNEFAAFYRESVGQEVYVRTRSAAKRAAVESLARSDRRHALAADVWDRDKLALNTPNGLVNLADGSMRPTRMDDYCRKCAAVAPEGECPLWMQFLADSCGGDMDLVSYLQVLSGMCATGDTREDFLGFIYGPGGNGKSVFIETLMHVLGSYAVNAGVQTFTETRSERHTTELARLAGARLVVAQETEQGKRWAESRIKELTGGGTITARFIGKDDFEFTPELKLIIVGNHKPTLRNVDDAIKRRFHLIPFTNKPAVVDKLLRSKLRAEAAGILRWVVDGAVMWLKAGLTKPKVVSDASAEYFASQDIVSQWVAECCDTGTACESGIRALHRSYTSYCHDRNEFALRQGEFKDALFARGGVTSGGSAKNPTLKGIQVRVDPDASLSRWGD